MFFLFFLNFFWGGGEKYRSIHPPCRQDPPPPPPCCFFLFCFSLFFFFFFLNYGWCSLKWKRNLKKQELWNPYTVVLMSAVWVCMPGSRVVIYFVYLSHAWRDEHPGLQTVNEAPAADGERNAPARIKPVAGRRRRVPRGKKLKCLHVFIFFILFFLGGGCS